MAVLGVVVGFLNVSADEAPGFLVAGIALLLSATALNSVPYLGAHIGTVMSNISVFLAGALFVVAIASVFQTSKD